MALETLKNKLEADISLLKQQHTQEVEEILHTFEGISLEEVDSNRALIQVRLHTEFRTETALLGRVFVCRVCLYVYVCREGVRT